MRSYPVLTLPSEAPMELRLLRYFVAVAEELNVTRAAERLHTSQPSLSQQIRQLEGLVGVSLFHRDKHHFQLSAAGKVLLKAARDIQAAVADAVVQTQAAARDEVGSMKLGLFAGPEGMVFSQLLPSLLVRCSGLQLSICTMTSPELIEALIRRDLTACFLRGPIHSEEIAWQVYKREEVVIVMPEQWDLARLDRVPPEALATMPWIPISETIAPAVHQVALDIQHRTGVTFPENIRSESLVTSLNAVASRLGFCLFSAYVGELLPKGVVIRPFALDPPPTLDLLFAYRKDVHSHELSTLIALVHERASTGLPASPP